MGKNPNDIVLMELSDGKVQMVLNLGIFPCKKKRKKILKLRIHKHKNRITKEEKAQQKHGAVAAF